MLTSNASAFARGDTATINQRSTSAQRACVRRVVEAKESRIGKQPVPVPKGVTYTLKDNHLSVKVRGGSDEAEGGGGGRRVEGIKNNVFHRARALETGIERRRGLGRGDVGRVEAAGSRVSVCWRASFFLFFFPSYVEFDD